MLHLRACGVSKGDRIGIYAPNSYHWLVYDLALLEIKAVSVAFTDDFKDSLNDDVLRKYGVALLLTSKRHLRKLGPVGVPIITMDDAERRCESIGQRTLPDTAIDDDLFGLVFSSGSSGGLKGLKISRDGIGHTLPPLFQAVGFKKNDRLLLFLPMSNFQQRFLCYGALWHDVDIILVDHAQLFQAMEKLSPTILLAPPIFYQMVWADYKKKPMWEKAANLAVANFLRLVPHAGIRQALARRSLHGLFRQFGGKIRLLVTGMAPLGSEISHFFRRMHLPLAEAYGMVEAGVIAYRAGNSKSFSSVGKPLPDVRLTFASDGEILVRRNRTVASGYFQCAEGESQSTFLEPGIIATGDIGFLDNDGNLILLGRKKEVIVAPSGHKVHPEVVEKQLDAHPEIASSVVFMGKDAGLRCVVNLAKPGDEEAKSRVRRFLADNVQLRKIFSFVTVIFADDPFTRENGMLRPNMKLDRRRIIERYSSV
jgi:long-chain acyl-CoA synthetase